MLARREHALQEVLDGELDLTARGNGHSWTIYLNHIVAKPGVALGATFKSQDVIGALSSDLNPTPSSH